MSRGNDTAGNRGGAYASPAWARLIATFFGIGRIRPGPGTWASLVTALLWAGAFSQVALSYRTGLTLGLAMLATVLGIPAASAMAGASGLKDPQIVVIDEVAGQLVALIAVPLTWKCLLAGFILFRVFDILKPPPVRQLERLPEGFGIVVDDLGAGLYALAVVHLMLHFRILIA